MRCITVVLSALVLLVTALPAVAQTGAGDQVWPGPNGSMSNTRRSPDVGPTAPGVVWSTPGSDIELPGGATFLGQNGANGDFGYDITADAAGHLIIQGEADNDDGDTAEWLLLALNAEDGSVAWTTDTEELVPERSCEVLLDSTDRLWTLARITSEADDGNARVLPVEIDQTDGTVVSRPLDDAPDEELPTSQRGNGCTFSPVLTPDDVFVFQMSVFDQPIVGFDLTDGSVAWQTDLDAAGLPPEVDWAIPTPDGERILVGVDDGPFTGTESVVIALDAADGAILGSTTVPGESFYAINEENPAIGLPDGSVVFGTDSGDQDGNLVRMTAELDVMWSVPTATDGPGDQLRPLATLSLGGTNADQVIGWSKSSPADVYAVSVEDGTLAWSANPDSFASVRSITVDAQGTAYVGVFNTGEDARLQVIGPDGTLGATVDADGDTETVAFGATNVTGMGPVIDGRLFLAVGTGAQTGFLAVEDEATGLVPGVSRPAGTSDDPRQIAIDLCQFLNTEPDSARAVILAQDEIFADALTGSPLAGDDGCVLFTGRAPEALDERTAAEIDRVLPDGGTVYLLGGVNAVAESVETDLSLTGYDVQRLAGPGRIQTAIAIAEEVQRLNPDNTAAMLAFEGNWPDAVAGGAYGAETGTPILLTRTDSVPEDTSATLDSLGVDDVTLLGSTGVISQAVEDSLPQPTVDRAGGSNRMATAVEIAERLWLEDTSTPGDTFLVVNLEAPSAWTISLAAAPLSAREDAPQLGVGNDRYPTETSGFLDAQGFTELPTLGLIGGLAFIGEDIESEIGDSIEG